MIARLKEIIRSHPSLILILLLGLVLRLRGLIRRDIWYDEALTILQSQKSFLQIIEDVPTPTHYFITRISLLLTDNLLLLHLTPIIFGLASLYLTYKLGELMLNKRTGLIAAFLLAISPIHIEFSQQILFFSYFVFFSLLSIYLLVLFVNSLNQKTNWTYFVLFGIAALLNVLNIMLAVVVTLIEVIYLLFSLFTHYKFKLKPLYLYALILITIAFGYLTYSIPGYKNLIDNLMHLDFDKPITLGYSLSHRLNSINLNNIPQFIYLMFSWFGLGYTWKFTLLVSLFTIGLISLFYRTKTRQYTFLVLTWIFLPFLFLFIFRLNHWFEEKYFIFIVPIYFLMIANGIVAITSLIKGDNSKIQLVILLGFLGLSLNALKTTTTYGYAIEGHITYDWNIVYRYLSEFVKPNDKILLSKDGTLFLDIYFGNDSKKYVFDETTIGKLTPEEYQLLTESTSNHYFVTIPDFSYLYLAPITKYEHLANIGNFGIYKLKFLKQYPHQIVSDYSNWGYYEDFRTATHLAHSQWNNFISSYVLPGFDAKLEGVNVLTPLNQEEARLSYHFLLPPNSTNLKLKSTFFLNTERQFQIYVGSPNQKTLIFEQDSDDSNIYQKEIDLSAYNQRSNLYLDFVFTKATQTESDPVFLKYFYLSGTQPEITEPMYVEAANEQGATTYSYNANLEVVKSSKWLKQVENSIGWFQTNEGFLVKYFDTPDNDLIYHLPFPEQIDMMKLYLKVGNHYTNPVETFYSKNGNNWLPLATLNKNVPEVYEFSLTDYNSSHLYLKFNPKLVGPSSQIRNITLEATATK